MEKKTYMTGYSGLHQRRAIRPEDISLLIFSAITGFFMCLKIEKKREEMKVSFSHNYNPA